MLVALAEVLLLIGAALCLIVSYAPADPRISSIIRPHWRVLTVVAFAVNFAVLQIPGRFDGDPEQVLKMSNLVAPAGWAFAIWGMIYVGELAGVVWIFLVQCQDCQEAIARSVLSWCAANMAQCLWCTAFRPWSIDQLWVSAIMLGCIAACLFASQQAMLKGFSATGTPATITRMAVVWPRSLHLGWTTAASIVNVNSYIGQASFGEEVALCFVVLSITLAAVVGLGYTASGLPTGTFAIAWALKAVSVGKPNGPDADKLGGQVLQGLSYSENAIAILLLVVILASVFANQVTSSVGQPKQPEQAPKDLEQELVKSSSDLLGQGVTDNTISG